MLFFVGEGRGSLTQLGQRTFDFKIKLLSGLSEAVDAERLFDLSHRIF